jgi:tetratricopeptide (TPR) repeat protein
MIQNPWNFQGVRRVKAVVCVTERQAGKVRQALWIFVLAFTPLLAGGAGAQPRDGNWTRCAGDRDYGDEVIIEACSAVVRTEHTSDADLAIAFKNLCLAYNDKGDHDRAIQDCDQAIRLHPGYLDAYLFRGHAYFNKGDNDRAIQDYDQAVALGSNGANTFVQRGAAYHMKGDNARAIQDLDQAIMLSPNDATAFYIRGAAYEAEKDNSHAIQDYGQAIRLVPRFAASLYRRGVLEKLTGDVVPGDADIAQARKIDPGIGK